MQRLLPDGSWGSSGTGQWTLILLQNGFKARNISGGMLSRSHLAEGL
jgi:hypothetical protein